MSNEKVYVGISKAPEDPEKKKEWVEAMKRLQISMWVGWATCEHCGHKYTSVDDFLRCNPKRGYGKTDQMTFVCDGCWKDYESQYKKNDRGSQA
jgi:hypothetical protein